jgi:hypothetical protein
MTGNTPARLPARNANVSPSKPQKMTTKDAIDVGVALGVSVACAIIQSCFDQPRYCAEVLKACGFETRSKLKAAGAEEYDLKLLKPVFAEIRGSSYG